jgi:hypothetical protein
MGPNEYRCEACNTVYTKAVTDEEALAESAVLFGICRPEELAVICDDCFNRINVPGTSTQAP